MSSIISIRNVSKSFGSQQVLKNLSLEIEREQTTTVIGPSGVGKSVLLKLIMGILAPDSGEIIVCGENMTTARSEREKNHIRRHLGVLFQSAALFDSMSVYDNIAFPLKSRTTMDRSEIHERVVEMAGRLSLEKHLYRHPEEIPIGVKKRVGLARAVMMHPEVLLFDEPNTGLDPLVGQEVYDLISLANDEWKLTSIVISHEIPEVFQVTDKIAMLLGGEIVAFGSPEELSASDHPAVQQFFSGSIDGPIKIQ